MPKHEITVEIDEKTGETSFEAHGVKGRGCLSVLKQLTETLGSEVSVKPTKEMYETEKVTVHR